MMESKSIKNSFPREWKKALLDEYVSLGVIKLERGQVISKVDIANTPGDNPIYSSSIQKNALFGRYQPYMFDEELITWSVDGGGNFFYRPKHKFSVTNVSGILRINDTSRFLYKYLYYLLDWEHQNFHFDYQSKAHPSVIRKMYTVFEPPLPEQKKIAEILSTVDDEIQKTDEIITATVKLKSGLMQELFLKGIGHSRFKETGIGAIPEEWGVVKLGDYVDIRSGDTPTAFEFKVDGSIPFYKVEDMNQSEKYLLSTRYHFDSYAKPLMPKGMIVFPKRGASIHTNKVRILSEDSYFDTNVMGLTTKQGLCNDYLYYLLVHIGLSQFADTTSIPQINNKHIEPLEIPLPKYEEQQIIAKIFSLLDEKIVVNKAIQKKILKLKKGLMEDLLTGKVRTEKYEHAG